VRECGSAEVGKLGSLEVLLSLTGTGISAKGFNPGGKSGSREVGSQEVERSGGLSFAINTKKRPQSLNWSRCEIEM
jgi:hypothetical protein